MAGVGDPVADAGDAPDGVGVAEFAAEPTDGDLDGLGGRVGVFVPCQGKQVFGGQGGWCGPDEGLEDGELFGGDLDLVSVAGDGAQ